MKTHLYLILSLSIALMLSACGGGDTPTAEVVPPTIEEQAVEPEVPTEAPTVAATPLPPIDVIREMLAANVANPELVDATLIQLMSDPVPDGESMVFHFENQVGGTNEGGTNVGCTGYALAQLQDDGSYAIVEESIKISCRPVSSIEPITHFAQTGVDETGQPVLVVFGEVYSADVVAIRISAGDTQVNSLISGGGHFATLPVDSADVVARAYNAAGEQIYEGEVSLPGESQPADEE